MMTRADRLDPESEHSVRTLADLARNGYDALRQPFTEVAFEVHHVADRPGRLLTCVTQEDRPRAFLETLTSGANGAGLIVGTRIGEMPHSPRYRDHGTSSDPSIQFSTHDGNFQFHGIARPNLTFLYESARRFEGIIALEDEARAATMHHSLLVKDVIKQITHCATEIADAPLLSVQCPVQRPIESTVERGSRKLPPSASLAVRFAIALRSPSVALRLELATHLQRYCEARGYRFWLADSRPGYRVGNWFGIRPRAQDDSSRHEHLPGSGEVDRVTRVLPVTFVGPARIGSTHALVSFLAQFNQVGIIGCSITSLDDLAFVHLQLALGERVPGRKADLATSYSDGETPIECLTTILRSMLGFEPRNLDTAVADTVRDHAGDYQTLAGPLLPYAPAQKERSLAIWVSWQMARHERGLATPIAGLAEAWRTLSRDHQAESSDPTIEYLICRDVGNSVLRGKGKMSIPLRVVSAMFPGHSAESAQSKLCVGLEDAWKIKLDADKKSGAHVLGVTVAWREYWLGHWSALV